MAVRKRNESVNESEALKLEKQNDTDECSDLDTGWAWMVLVASFGTFFLIGNCMYSVGIIHSSLLERYGESVSLTSWAGALHTALMSLGGPVSSAVIDRFSCRVAIISSGILFMIGYIGTAFAGNIHVAILTCGIIAGGGAGLGYTAALVVVGFNFRRKRNLALGIAVSGIGAGLFVLAPLMQMSRDYYGPAGFFIILAAITANIITFGCMCFTSQLEKHTKKQRNIQYRYSNEKKSLICGLKPYFDALVNKPMICLYVGNFFYCLGTYLIYLHLPSYVTNKGFTDLQAAFLISLSGIVCLFGRLFTGVLASLSWVNDLFLYAGPMGIVGLATAVYPFTSQYFAGHVAYVVLLGLFFGSCYVTVTGVTLKFVDISYVASGLGAQFCFGGIGAVVGPVLAGQVVDVSGSYEISIIISSVCILLASIVSGVTVIFERKTENVLEVKLDTTEKVDMP